MNQLSIAAGMSDQWLRQAMRSIEAEHGGGANTSDPTNGALALTRQRLALLMYQPAVDTTTAVECFIEAARLHGQDSEPDHEVGDLQDFLRAVWKQLTPAQRAATLLSSEVSQVLEGAGQQALATRDEDVDDWERVCDFYGLDTSFQYGEAAILEFTNMFRLEALRPRDGEGARYVHGTWEHIFAEGSSPTAVRLAFDRVENRIEAMELKRLGRWEPASEMHIADVEDSLRNANPEAIARPGEYGLSESEQLPAWCAPQPERAVQRQRP